MTTSPSPCSHLDDYLDGDLSEADVSAFETHVEACSECSTDLTASQLLTMEWTRLADVSAPVGLVDAALRMARRGAADRAPARTARPRFKRLAGWVMAAALVIALASALLWMQPDHRSSPPQQASADAPARIDTAVTPPAENPIPSNSAQDPSLASEAPAVRPTAPPQRQRVTSPARRQLASPAPRPVYEEPPLQLAEQTATPVDSVAQAQQDLMLALALIADAQSRVGSTVSSEIGRATGALTETSLF